MKENFETYYVVSYKEYTGNENFGTLNGLIYETMEDALTALKNDIEEYKIGLGEDVEVFGDECDCSLYENGEIVCSWRIEPLRMSREFNGLDT